jgi:hypothetical protein
MAFTDGITEPPTRVNIYGSHSVALGAESRGSFRRIRVTTLTCPFAASFAFDVIGCADTASQQRDAGTCPIDCRNSMSWICDAVPASTH